ERRANGLVTRPPFPHRPARRSRPGPVAADAVPPRVPARSAVPAASCRPSRTPCPASQSGSSARPPARPGPPTPAAADILLSVAHCPDVGGRSRPPAIRSGHDGPARNRPPSLATPAVPTGNNAAAIRPTPEPPLSAYADRPALPAHRLPT